MEEKTQLRRSTIGVGTLDGVTAQGPLGSKFESKHQRLVTHGFVPTLDAQNAARRRCVTSDMVESQKQTVVFLKPTQDEDGTSMGRLSWSRSLQRNEFGSHNPRENKPDVAAALSRGPRPNQIKSEQQL